MPRPRRDVCGSAVALALALAPWTAAAAPAPPTQLVVVSVGSTAPLAQAVVTAGQARSDLTFRAFTPARTHAAAAPPTRAIKTALGRATRAFAAFDLDEAERRLADATKLLAPHARGRAVVALEREALVLAVSLAHASRDDRGLDAALTAYALRFPGQGPPERTPWPPVLVTRLDKKAPPRDASLSIKSTPAGARLALDGEDAGVTPAAVTQLVAGPHRVQAELPGYVAADQLIELSAGAGAVVELELAVDLPAALATATADAPLPPPVAAALRAELPAGARVLLVEARGSGAVLAALGASARATTPRQGPADLAAALDTLLGPAPGAPEAPGRPGEAGRPGPPTWAWIALGAGVASIGAGIGTRVSAVSVEHELISREGALTQTEAFEIRSDAETRASAGTVLIALGLAVASGVGAWLVYTAHE